MVRDRSLDIAVTGISGRFPNAPDVASLWEAVKAGRVLTTRHDRQDLADAGVPRVLLDDPGYVPVRGHLDDADRFDAALFRISPREAELMDPQHRLILETAWSALEDAGTDPLGVAPVTAVYASASGSGYLRAMAAGGLLDPVTLEDAVHGTEPDFLASLVSYRLGLTGPAMAVQTACSSSLVAVHLATQALLNGDCDQALVVAAGIPYPQGGHLHLPGGIHSPTGRCRPFDGEADGVVAGSGVACVVLRRLQDALDEDLDPYGVVLGTAINNDGSAKAGYYAPSVGGQQAVIRAALRAADVDGTTVGYLETHGTGTRVGDPIEWAAASAALAAAGARPGQVAVGALKANTGHLDNAAGVAALIKALLVVRHGVVPPVAGFTTPNPLLESEGSPLHVPREAAAWTGPEPRRAGVSAFGIGGTNAHVVVEQPPLRPVTPPVTPAATPTPAAVPAAGSSAATAVTATAPTAPTAPAEVPRERLVVLSAADPEALARAADRTGRHLVTTGADLADVASTLATGRAALPWRLAVTGRGGAEVAARLRSGEGVVTGRRPVSGTVPAVFLFPGQGTQHPGMARPFAEALPGFRQALDDCLAALDDGLGATGGSGATDGSGTVPTPGLLRTLLLDRGAPADALADTVLAQPALFAVGYAAATALADLGVRPAAVAGHSLGEITAACVAGALGLADAARLVIARGRAMQACPEGAMLALGCTEDEALAWIAAAGALVGVAAVNTPDSCVVAGAPGEIDAFEAWLAGRTFTRRLATARAFHSPLIEPALAAVAEAAAGSSPQVLRVPLAANATGRLLPAGAVLAPGHFAGQARGAVRFADGLAAVAAQLPGAVAVEIGPGRVLSAMADAAGLPAVPLSPDRTAGPGAEVLAALGALWVEGLPLAPGGLCGGGRTVHLPGYAFAGPRWIAPEARPRPAAVAPTAAVTTAAAPGAVTAAAVTATAEAEAAVAVAAAVTVAVGPAVPDPSAAAGTATVPDVDVAVLMTRCWRELLGHDGLTDASDFFELGGDSLLITRLAHRIRQELGIRVPVRDMLLGRTLGRQTELARRLLHGSTETVPAGVS
ncbi:type I polyketide synthase [Kitasatospora sp. NBC_01539]|uniref:type I polyketide synthase n=1 Tax=Kitasatospora sp. NBC_01539 TaxID=2903577 RepID=UPI0038601AED